MKKPKTFYSVVAYDEQYKPSYLVYLVWLFNHGKPTPSFRIERKVLKPEFIGGVSYIIFSDKSEFVRVGELTETSMN